MPAVVTKFVLGSAALGLALRLLFALAYWTGQPLTRDEHEYLSLARSVAAGRGFVYDDAVQADPFGRAPGYPTFLALTGGGARVTDAVPIPVKLAQSLIGAFGVVLVGLIAFRLAGRRAAQIAAMVAALYPPLVWIAAYAFSEAIAWPVGLAVAWQFDRAMAAERRHPSVEGRGNPTRAGLACGVIAGLGALIRPAGLFFLVVAGVWLIWRRRLTFALALTGGALVVILPWTIRNYAHYGRVVLIATEGGVTFWTGNNPLARGEGDLAANPDLKREHQALRARHAELSEEQMEPVYYREALAWIGGHPLEWLALEVRKLLYLVVPAGPSYRVHSTRYYVASVVSYGLLVPVAIAGLWRLGRARSRTPGLWLLWASAVGVCLVFFPQERFRIPAIDPVLIICAGSAFMGKDAFDSV